MHCYGFNLSMNFHRSRSKNICYHTLMKIQQQKHRERKMLNKPEKTRIFTFAPRDFWAVDEETEVLHMYIIAK